MKKGGANQTQQTESGARRIATQARASSRPRSGSRQILGVEYGKHSTYSLSYAIDSRQHEVVRRNSHEWPRGSSLPLFSLFLSLPVSLCAAALHYREGLRTEAPTMTMTTSISMTMAVGTDYRSQDLAVTRALDYIQPVTAGLARCVRPKGKRKRTLSRPEIPHVAFHPCPSGRARPLHCAPRTNRRTGPGTRATERRRGGKTVVIDNFTSAVRCGIKPGMARTREFGGLFGSFSGAIKEAQGI